MRIESWKLVYIGGILSLLSLFIPTHFNGAIGGSDFFFNYTWMLGFIIQFKNKIPYAIYWLGHARFPIWIIWMLISPILALIVMISSISMIKYVINIKNNKIDNKNNSRKFADLLFSTAIFYIIFTSAMWMIPIYGSISLMIGAILSMIGIRKLFLEI